MFRRSVRLHLFNYSQGGDYFITICTHRREQRFGRVVDGIMHPNEIGEIVIEEWIRTPELRSNVKLDKFQLMPNHFHGILTLAYDDHDWMPERFGRPTQSSVPSIARGFKGAVTRRVPPEELPLWQRNYYEHVIRDEQSLERIRDYIVNNPRRWQFDRENPNRSGTDTFELWLEGYEARGRGARRGRAPTAGAGKPSSNGTGRY